MSAGISFAQATSFARGLDLNGVDPFAHTWSLSIEWCFYLVWPLALFWAKTRGVAPRVLASWALLAAILLFIVSVPASMTWFYYGPTSRATQLLAGCALALWLTDGAVPHLPMRLVNAAVAASVGLIVVWTVFGTSQHDELYRWVGFPLITVSSVALCGAPAFSRDGRTVRLLSTAPLAALGRCSYSLYLWHLLAIQVLSKDDYSIPMPLLAVIAVVSTGALTWVSYRYLEVPFVSSRGSSLRDAAQDRPTISGLGRG